MAIYHLSIKIISRGKGQSAVASAAYRSGEKITNEYDGAICDYTKKGGIVHTEILLPDNAPSEYLDRSTLWNAVEQVEKNKNSQLAREIELAFPKELSFEEQKSLVHEYCKQQFVSVGMCADICIHDKNEVLYCKGCLNRTTKIKSKRLICSDLAWFCSKGGRILSNKYNFA